MDESLSYDEAHKKCLDEDGTLAVVYPDMPGLDKMKAAVLQNTATTNYTAWIVRDYTEPHNSNFPEGKSRWDPHCINLNHLETLCEAGSYSKLPYFCERYKYNPCGPDGNYQKWSYRDGHCFKVITSTTEFTFDEANKACRDLPGNRTHLVTIYSKSQNMLVTRLLEDEGFRCGEIYGKAGEALTKATWIGLYFTKYFGGDPEIQVHGVWVSAPDMDGYQKYEEKHLTKMENRGQYPWARAQPNNLDMERCCVIINTNMLWIDGDCNFKLKAAVCSQPYARGLNGYDHA